MWKYWCLWSRNWFLKWTLLWFCPSQFFFSPVLQDHTWLPMLWQHFDGLFALHHYKPSVKTHCLLHAAVRLMWGKDRGTEGGWWQWQGRGQWWQCAPQQEIVVCGGDQWCPTPICQAGNFSRAGYWGSGTKWTVWGLSLDCMGVYIQLGHGLCVGLNSVTKRSVREWCNAQSGWRAAQQGHSDMFHNLLANGTTLSYLRTPLGIQDPHKGTLSSHLGLSCIYPCRG